MPFNRELEDFAQAFSSGYSMSKSPQEREAERLQLESARFANERAPIVAGQEDIKFGLDVEAKKMALTDAQAARERAKVDQAHADAAWELDQQIRKNQITQQEADAKRKLIDDAHADQLHDINMRKEGALTSQAEYLTSEPVREQERRKGEADIQQSQAATESSRATTEGQQVETEAKRLGLKKLQNEATLWDSAISTVNSRKAAIPEENQPRVIADPNASSAEAVPEGPAPFVLRKPVPTVGPVIEGAPAAGGGLSVGATPQGPGPTGAVEVPPVPAGSPAGSESSLGTFNPPLSDGELAPEPVPPPTAPTPTPTPPAPPATLPTEAVATGAAEAPALPVTEDARISYEDPKQRIIDNIVNGRPNQVPGGKSNMKAGAREAVKDGLGLLMQEHGMNDDYAVGTPEVDNQQLGFLTGARAADPATVKMVEDTVEEQVGEELSQNEKTYYTLATGWIYYNGIGDADAAQRYAASTLAHYQKAFSQYTAVMQAAASSGDMDGTMEAAARAYANVPTGDELHLSWTEDKKHIKATITDMDGKVIEKQLMTPEEMGAFAMGVNPSSYVSFISQAAGREDKSISPAAAGALSGQLGIPPEQLEQMTTEEITRLQTGQRNEAIGAQEGLLTPDQIDTSRENVSTKFDQFVVDNPKFEDYLNNEETGKRNDLERVAAQLHQNNYRTLSPEDAVATTMNIVTNGLSAPPVMPEGDPNAYIDAGFGTLTLPKETYKTLVVLRKMGGFPGEKSKVTAPDNKPGVLQKAWDAFTTDTDTAPAPNFYAIKPPAVYDPNRVDPIIETVKKAWEGLTAVPTGPIPPYNPSGRPGYGQRMNRPKGSKNYLQR